jgi:hypothetical protein
MINTLVLPSLLCAMISIFLYSNVSLAQVNPSALNNDSVHEALLDHSTLNHFTSLETTDPLILSKIKALLIQYETTISREHLTQITDEKTIRNHLFFIYKTSNNRQVKRNSLATLAYFPNIQVKTLILDILKDPNTASYLIRGALSAYSYAFKTEAIDIIIRYALFHKQVSIRKTAIKLLGSMNHHQAHKALTQALSVESHPRLKSYITKWLTKN